MTMNARTFESMQDVLAGCTYKDWRLIVRIDPAGGRAYLQWGFNAPCATSSGMQQWTTRKHDLSACMTDSELVRTAFYAALQAEEHECREAEGLPLTATRELLAGAPLADLCDLCSAIERAAKPELRRLAREAVRAESLGRPADDLAALVAAVHTELARRTMDAMSTRSRDDAYVAAVRALARRIGLDTDAIVQRWAEACAEVA